MWLAHAMTVVRLPLAVVFWWVATERIAAVGVIAAAAVTDALDGALARRAIARGAGGWSARVGAWLDPLCDKLFAVTVMVALAVRAGTPLGWLLLVAARDLVLVPVTAVYRFTSLRERFPIELRAAPLGKVATAAQFAAVAAIVGGMAGAFWVCIGTAIVGAVAAADYVVRALRARRGVGLISPVA